MATVRPIRETIPLEDARALVLDAARPIERTERIAIADAHGRVIAVDSRFDRRRAAIRPRRHGWLCRHRRGHVRRQCVRAESAALDRDGVYRRDCTPAGDARHLHANRDRRAASRRRRRRRHGRRNREARCRRDPDPDAGLSATTRRTTRRRHYASDKPCSRLATC